MRSCELVAPRFGGGKIPVWQDGLLWEVPVLSGPSQGWGLWRLEDEQASFVRPAAAWERERAFPGRPRQVVHLLEELKSGLWKAAGPGRKELLVTLVDQGAVFDALRVVDGGLRWWSLGLASGRTGKARRWREALEQGQPVPSLKPGLARARSQNDPGLVLARAVEMAGGRLLGWVSVANGYQVTWERQGRQITSLVDRQLNLQHAGICLANTDRQHDLTSLVSLISERGMSAEEYHYFYGGGWS